MTVFKDPETGKLIYQIVIRCSKCNDLIRTFQSDTDFRMVVHTNTNAGIYPTDLCPCCAAYYIDPEKKDEDNPKIEIMRNRDQGVPKHDI